MISQKFTPCPDMLPFEKFDGHQLTKILISEHTAEASQTHRSLQQLLEVFIGLCLSVSSE